MTELCIRNTAYDLQTPDPTCVADGQHINLVHPLALTHAAKHHCCVRQFWVRVLSGHGASMCRLEYD